jgi:hypothetical protein
MRRLEDRLETLRRSVERQIGERIVVRGVRTPDPEFRGRISRQRGRVLIEVQEAMPGYFWEAELAEALLWRVAAGVRSATVTEADLRADRLSRQRRSPASE